MKAGAWSLASLAILSLVGCAADPDRLDDERCADLPADPAEHVAEARGAITVADAVASGCSTTSVKGLSEQIVAQANCISPGAFVDVGKPANLTLGGAVFPYLEEPAKDALVGALAAHPGTTMTINSMLRTVAQQYLLYAWYQAGSCGIGLAAKPGNSNHETGLALDVQEHATWQAALEAVGFAWLGASDPVHFDYAGPGAVSYKGTDVLAFQQLWNANHPNDPIAEDGDYGPATEARLVQAPAGGFPSGADCGASSSSSGAASTSSSTSGASTGAAGSGGAGAGGAATTASGGPSPSGAGGAAATGTGTGGAGESGGAGGEGGADEPWMANRGACSCRLPGAEVTAGPLSCPTSPSGSGAALSALVVGLAALRVRRRPVTSC